jgi:hypothetical protein
MFMNSQVGAPIARKIGKFIDASCLSEPNAGISGWDRRRGVGGLIGAAVIALSERHLGGVKTSLVITAIAGLAWQIATAFFAAGNCCQQNASGR